MTQATIEPPKVRSCEKISSLPPKRNPTSILYKTGNFFKKFLLWFFGAPEATRGAI
jgi:hypothetical protein